MPQPVDVHLPPEIAAALQTNPLLKLWFIASALAEVTESRYGSEDQFPLMPWLRMANHEPFPADGAGRPVYPSREMAGVAGLQMYLAATGEFEVVFVNDLSWERHGIDAIGRDRCTGRWVICEAKGTSSLHLRGPGYYLAHTRRKGRQLSWAWCWRSLEEFAGYGPTAALFLQLAEPFLRGETERLLVVTRVEPVPGGFCVTDSRAWDEATIAQMAEFRDGHVLEQPRRCLDDVQSLLARTTKPAEKARHTP